MTPVLHRTEGKKPPRGSPLAVERGRVQRFGGWLLLKPWLTKHKNPKFSLDKIHADLRETRFFTKSLEQFSQISPRSARTRRCGWRQSTVYDMPQDGVEGFK